MREFGGFWRRFLAYLIDAIIVNIAATVVGAMIGAVLGVAMQVGGSSQAAIQTAGSLLGGGIGLVGSWLYFSILESSSLQATFGKKALGMIVTDESGRRISFGRATGRYFAKMISGFILLFGFFMIGWTQRKQGLHDMIAGTLVYKARDPHEVYVDVEAFS